MFTGLIEDVGTITGITTRGNYRILTISSRLADEQLRVGDSVDCDGACLTVVEVNPGSLVVEASQETAARTILGTYRRGSRLNLERALQAGARLGGHFVLGHVDCTGAVDTIRSIGESLEITVAFDRKYDPLVIEKGSIAINGISLTINAEKPGRLTVNIIPHSVTQTTVAEFKPGQKVNLEFDLIGKYILKIHSSRESNTLTSDILRESGW
jgi:riboflavin synthase